jgi:hypothetical protein
VRVAAHHLGALALLVPAARPGAGELPGASGAAAGGEEAQRSLGWPGPLQALAGCAASPVAGARCPGGKLQDAHGAAGSSRAAAAYSRCPLACRCVLQPSGAARRPAAPR